jgi:hypothetical protein
MKRRKEALVLRTRFAQVFAIGEEVKETNDSGFLGTVPTLHCQLLGDNSLLQARVACVRCCGVYSTPPNTLHIISAVREAPPPVAYLRLLVPHLTFPTSSV